MEDLTSNWTRLTLSDREGSSCDRDEDCEVHEFIIAAKFLTVRLWALFVMLGCLLLH